MERGTPSPFIVYLFCYKELHSYSNSLSSFSISSVTTVAYFMTSLEEPSRYWNSLRYRLVTIILYWRNRNLTEYDIVDRQQKTVTTSYKIFLIIIICNVVWLFRVRKKDIKSYPDVPPPYFICCKIGLLRYSNTYFCKIRTWTISYSSIIRINILDRIESPYFNKSL